MRGEVLQYDDAAGSGLISGDDGGRYPFRRADMQQLRPLARGIRVDFVVRDGSACEIFVLSPEPGSEGLESSGEDLSLWGYFGKAMSKSFSGEGRARRKEYWSFVLFESLFVIGAFLIAAFTISALSGSGYYYDEYNPGGVLGPFLMVGAFILILVFVPAAITVTIRRLHDIGLTGWWYLTIFIPYLGGLFLFVVSLIPSERRVNKHGQYPKPLD